VIAIREVTDEHDPAIAVFGRLQRSVYYAPETLQVAGHGVEDGE
jgi:hypothetical protein